MRLFAYPAALFLAFVLYCAAPKFAGGLARALQKLYALFQQLDARAPRKLAFPAFLLTLMLVPFLLALLHPAVEAVLMAFPLFGLSCIPRSGAVKRELDSGAYSRDIPAYESLVRDTCAALAPAFVAHVCVPLVLMAVGLPLRLSAALGWGFLALSAVSNENEQADRLLGLLVRPADALFSFLLLLCSGVAGRSPFRIGGRDVKSRLMNILGVAQDATATHAPVSGDISQGTFLCCFCTVFLCLVMTLLLLPFIR